MSSSKGDAVMADVKSSAEDDSPASQSISLSGRPVPTQVVVHPLVLLSVVDHYNRIAKDTNKRVVGVLLGEVYKGRVDVTNSYAVPFEEDESGKDPIWFLDHDFHETMYQMFKKVNHKEKVVGWYSTGPKVRPADLEIHELFRRYVAHPVFCIIDVQPKELGLPTDAYVAIAENKEKEDGKEKIVTFQHLHSEIGAYEAEEIGVEHLLRDIKDTSISTLSQDVTNKIQAIKGFESRLTEIHTYLSNVAEGRLPVNHNIIYNLQDVFNLLPNLNVDSLVKAFAVKTNDQMVVIYLSAMIRSIIALHNLINNKIESRNVEKKDLADRKETKKSSKDLAVKEGGEEEKPSTEDK